MRIIRKNLTSERVDVLTRAAEPPTIVVTEGLTRIVFRAPAVPLLDDVRYAIELDDDERLQLALDLLSVPSDLDESQRRVVAQLEQITREGLEKQVSDCERLRMIEHLRMFKRRELHLAALKLLLIERLHSDQRAHLDAR